MNHSHDPLDFLSMIDDAFEPPDIIRAADDWGDIDSLKREQMDAGLRAQLDTANTQLRHSTELVNQLAEALKQEREKTFNLQRQNSELKNLADSLDNDYATRVGQCIVLNEQATQLRESNHALQSDLDAAAQELRKFKHKLTKTTRRFLADFKKDKVGLNQARKLVHDILVQASN